MEFHLFLFSFVFKCRIIVIWTKVNWQCDTSGIGAYITYECDNNVSWFVLFVPVSERRIRTKTLQMETSDALVKTHKYVCLHMIWWHSHIDQVLHSSGKGKELATSITQYSNIALNLFSLVNANDFLLLKALNHCDFTKVHFSLLLCLEELCTI